MSINFIKDNGRIIAATITDPWGFFTKLDRIENETFEEFEKRVLDEAY